MSLNSHGSQNCDLTREIVQFCNLNGLSEFAYGKDNKLGWSDGDRHTKSEKTIRTVCGTVSVHFVRSCGSWVRFVTYFP